MQVYLWQPVDEHGQVLHDFRRTFGNDAKTY